jgi:hypothetical protein
MRGWQFWRIRAGAWILVVDTLAVIASQSRSLLALETYFTGRENNSVCTRIHHAVTFFNPTAGVTLPTGTNKASLQWAF